MLRLTVVGLLLVSGGVVLADDPAVADKADAHLTAWEKSTKGTTNFRAEFTLTRKDAVFGKERVYTGAVVHMRPRFTVLRMDNAADKRDYEAYICDGKALYEYSGLNQTITEIPLRTEPADRVATSPPSDWLSKLLERALRSVTDPERNFPLMVLSGVNAEALKKRFRVSMFKEDENYVYLEFEPVDGKDRAMFQKVRIALHGPGERTPEGVPDGTVPVAPYTPAQVCMLKPNGDTELWKFTDVRRNLPGVDEKGFQFRQVPGYRFIKAPAPQPEALRP